MRARIQDFRDKVWDYYRENGRDLEWRHEPTPYQVVVSELMLQQTQVVRVAERYPRWMKRFPSFEQLAKASIAEVLEEWQGMGYNRRGLFLHRIAQAVMSENGGILPSDPAELVKLPGIGINTAGSIAAFAYNLPVVFIETNIRRVFIHEFFGEQTLSSRAQPRDLRGDFSSTVEMTEKVSDTQLMPLIAEAIDHEHPREWYYALMDYGSYLAKTVVNPNRRSKHHTTQSKFEGSKRQIRGEVLRQLMAGSRQTFEIDDARLEVVLADMLKEGFIVQNGETYALAE